MARPTKFTEELGQKLLDALRAGHYMHVAAALVGIAESTLYRWIERGEEGESPFKQFACDVARARAEAESRALLLIQKAALTNWQAAAWFLERAYPLRWGRRPPAPPETEEPVHITVVWPEHADQLELQAKTQR